MTIPVRWMYDDAFPPRHPPRFPVVAGYIGGDTPHVWTREEWDSQPAPFRLPIFTADNRADSPASAAVDAPVILAKLEELGVARGKAVALDGETRIFPAYLEELDELLGEYKLMDYGSLSFVVHNPVTSGGRWAADWTNSISDALHLIGINSITAVQWASSDMRRTPYDWSIIEDSIQLWHP